MKNFVIASMIFVGLTGFSFGGDCTKGFCNRPSGRIVSATKEVVKVSPRVVSKCVNGKCNIRKK